MADLEQVISGALEAAESGDEAVDTATDTTETVDTGADATDTTVDTDTSTDEHVEPDAEAVAKAEADAKAAAALEDAFAKEHGLTPLDQRKRENRIPYSNVKKIVENAQKKLAEALFGDKLAADKPYIDQIKGHATRYTEIEQENQGLKHQLSEVDQVEQIMIERPEQFLALLPHINPKFAELLAGKGAAEAKETPTPAELPKPDMDVTLPDGTKAKTYSVDGIVSLVQAVAAQTRDKTLKDVDAKVKPFTDREQAARTDAQIIDRLAARVNHARQNWRGFKDWEADIQAELGKDREQAARTRTRPTLDLQDAYIRVRDRKHDEELAKLKTDRETMRKDIVKEINGRPRTTAAAGARRVTSGSAGDKPRTMEEVIKAALDESGIK